MKPLFVSVGVVVLAGVIVGNACAYRAPTETERRRQIVAAIFDKQRHQQTATASAHLPSAHLADQGLAREHPLRERHPLGPGLPRRVCPAAQAVRDVARHGHRDLNYVGCAKAPKAVRIDLELVPGSGSAKRPNTPAQGGLRRGTRRREAESRRSSCDES